MPVNLLFAHDCRRSISKDAEKLQHNLDGEKKETLFLIFAYSSAFRQVLIFCN
jgi:hypothetical protein